MYLLVFGFEIEVEFVLSIDLDCRKFWQIQNSVLPFRYHRVVLVVPTTALKDLLLVIFRLVLWNSIPVVFSDVSALLLALGREACCGVTHS